MDDIKHCLVTGAGGFLGRYVLDALQQANICTRILLRQPKADLSPCTEVVINDLSRIGTSDFENLLHGIDTVLHLAATAHVSADPACYEADYKNTLHLVKAAEKCGARCFVFVSSTKAAAEPGAQMRDEQWDIWPSDAYGYWKRKTEQHLLYETSIPHVVIVRPCLMYGIGVKGNLQALITMAGKAVFPELAKSVVQRSMVYAGDVAAALLLLVSTPTANRQIFIAADNESYSPNALIRAVRDSLGKSAVRWCVPEWCLCGLGRVGEMLIALGWKRCPLNSQAVSRLTESAAYSSAKLQALGWRPSTTFYQELPAILSAVPRGARK